MSMFITEKEIMSQHVALEKTIVLMKEKSSGLKKWFEEKKFKQMLFLGCGSSYMLSRTAASLFAVDAGVKAYAVAAGDFMLRPDAYKSLLEDAMVVLITRSGKTSELLFALERIREMSNAQCLCIHACTGSEIPKLSDQEIGLDWAFDSSVCQTRTITNFYTALAYLMAVYSDDEKLKQQLECAVKQNEAYKLAQLDLLEEVARQDWNNVVVLGDGELHGLLSEGALAFNEICMLPAVQYNLLDFRHGPTVLVNEKTLLIALLREGGKEKQFDMMRDMKKRGAKILAISAYDEVPNADYTIQLKGLTDYLAWGIPFIYVPQRLAYNKAVLNGVNPDSPQGLEAYISL